MPQVTAQGHRVAGLSFGRRAAQGQQRGSGHRKPHRLITVCLAAVATMAASTVALSSPALASTGEFDFQATAYGTQVLVASIVKSGPSALVTLGCTSSTGITHTNTAASVAVPDILTTGTIDTTAASKATATGIASTASATTQQVSALSGLVSASEVKSVSTTNENSSTGVFSVSAAGTQFLGLIVAGRSISGTPAPNTEISLPGVGYVILNQQIKHVGSLSAGLTVIAIHLFVTTSTPLVQAGTQIIVSFAQSSLTGPVKGLLNGYSYGSFAAVGSTLIAGHSFPETLPCLGTGGVTRTNSGLAVTIPSILTTGTVTDTAEGVVSSTTVSGKMTSTVQKVNLLAGTVTATGVEADVTAQGNPPTLTDNSTFVGLSVSGFPKIGDNVPPNTKLVLPGIGTLWLHRQIKTSNSIHVIMIELIVTTSPNPFGLKIGTVVKVASASVGVS